MNQKLKWKYLAFVFVVILISVMVRVGFDFKNHQAQLDQAIERLSHDALIYFSDLEKGLQDKYLTLTHHYAKEVVMQQYFKNNDRSSLYDYVSVDYQYLRSSDPSLHVMHFIYPDNRTLLRMHQPANFGDDLTQIRPIVRDANSSLKPLQGFEVGKNGITYRITTPLISRSGEHYGLLEFGIRPNYFVDRLIERFDVDSMILVKTDSLGKLIASYDFEGLDEFSVIQQSRLFRSIMPHIDLAQNNQLIKHENETYLVLNNLNHKSYQGEVIAKLVIAQNISALIKDYQVSLLEENILSLFVLFFLVLMVYLMFNRYSQALEKSYDTIQALHLQSHQLKSQANTDELTGLYNRRFFNESLHKVIELKQAGSLLFFDIDHFKALNDAHGHQAGDQVLQELSQMLQAFFRQDDMIVRWGGEEFAVFLHDMPKADAVLKADRFRHFVETASRKHQFSITVSGGVTEIRAQDKVEDIFKRVDQRLYQAKKAGRNRIVSLDS